jgi:uncharacterized protein YjbI with pentapeptide repeats
MYARLDGANLAAANLTYAILDFADLRSAILTKTNLKGTNLRYVQNLTQAQINDSICDNTTAFPADLVHPLSTLVLPREAARYIHRNVGFMSAFRG